MKVVMLSTSYPRWEGDPSSPFIEGLCKELVKKGIEVNVVAPHDVGTKEYEIISGVKIHRFQYWFTKKGQKLAYHGGMPYNIAHFLFSKIQLPFFMISFFLKGLKVSKRCDIIHAQFLLSGIIGIFIKKLTKRKLVLTIHAGGLFGLEKMPFKSKIARLIAIETDRLNTVSNFIKKRFLNLLSLRTSLKIQNKIIVQSMGIDIKRFDLSLEAKDVTKNKKTILLFVGRLSDKKGLPILINAINILKDSTKNFLLYIVGHGPLKNIMEKKIDDLELNKYIKFMGKVSDQKLTELYLTSDIVVVPSIISEYGDTEGLPVVILEAMAAGRAVVASDVGGISDVVNDGETGYLVESNNTQQLAEKIFYLINNPEERKRMGLNSRKIVKEKYSWEIIAERTIELYQDFT